MLLFFKFFGEVKSRRTIRALIKKLIKAIDNA